MNQTPPPVTAIVLAAGKGTRMKSQLPKVLHPVLGRPMVCYPIDAALAAQVQQVVVVIGHGAELVQGALQERYDTRVRTAVQAEQLGTGDAARSGAAVLDAFKGYLLIVNGDAPLLGAAALRELISRTREEGATMGVMVSELADATGYGRILRDEHGAIRAVVEEKDCTAEQRAIREWNPGIYLIQSDFFHEQIQRLNTDNAAGELYLTDLVAAAGRSGDKIVDIHWRADDLVGVNDRLELVQREQVLRSRLLEQHACNGVTIRDPQTTFIDADVVIGSDVTLAGNVHLRGRSQIGAWTNIDVGCVLHNVVVGEHCQLLPYTVATDSHIGNRARLGPFSHLRPQSQLDDDTHVGNFVETKKTRLGQGSKANHLAYLGDGEIGRNVNVGAGVIFCNYDGFNKHKTILEDDVFVGSDSQLVAPVTIGRSAYVGTGTTVTQDVPPEALAIGRARQVNKPELATRLKAKLRALKEAAVKAAKAG